MSPIASRARSADLVVADTPAHAAYFSELTGVPRERFRVLWVGAQERVFSPAPEVAAVPRLVLFYGTYVPLQGIDTIVRAAKLLEHDDVRIRIIGDGQERERIEELVADLGVPNVELVGMVPLEDLPGEIARASLCLGIFGTSEKASRVVPNKLFEALAVGRPVVTADTEAIRSAFDGEVATVPAGDPGALAGAIRELLDDPERLGHLAAAGRARFVESYSAPALTRLLERIIADVVATPG